jgi:hypothetical protein
MPRVRCVLGEQLASLVKAQRMRHREYVRPDRHDRQPVSDNYKPASSACCYRDAPRALMLRTCRSVA